MVVLRTAVEVSLQTSALHCTFLKMFFFGSTQPEYNDTIFGPILLTTRSAVGSTLSQQPALASNRSGTGLSTAAKEKLLKMDLERKTVRLLGKWVSSFDWNANCVFLSMALRCFHGPKKSSLAHIWMPVGLALHPVSKENTIKEEEIKVRDTLQSCEPYPDLQSFCQACSSWLASLVAMGPSADAKQDQTEDPLTPKSHALRKQDRANPNHECSNQGSSRLVKLQECLNVRAYLPPISCHLPARLFVLMSLQRKSCSSMRRT